MKKISLWALLACPLATQAMSLSETGHGDALIYPYYTVNNELNTLYTVINTTADTKAIKVRFLEGQNGAEVMDFNVYLDAFDVWTAALAPTISTISGHAGENSVVHISNDQSCAPFLNKSGQEFLPYVLDAEDPQNNDMQRSREGHIEIIEMSTFDGPTVAWSDHGNVGVPASCASIQADWADNNIYDTADEYLVSGGLVGWADIINVANGQQLSFPAVAVENFWTIQVGSHTEPGSFFPNLAAGDIRSEMLLEGSWQSADWNFGAESITALLMHYELINEYSIDDINGSHTEWVITFPTKRFHVNGSSNTAVPPFTAAWDGFEACEDAAFTVWDSAELTQTPVSRPTFCHSANVLQFSAPGQAPAYPSTILGARNVADVSGVDSANAQPFGWGRLTFDNPLNQMTPFTGSGLMGLPAIGFQVQRFINTNAQPGLLAHYVHATQHKGNNRAIPNQANQASGGDHE